MKKMWTPTKRDTNLFLDLIAQLKASQKFQHELNIQINSQKKLIKVLGMPMVILYLGIIVAPAYCLQKLYERKINCSKGKQTLDTMEKQEKIYHKNVLSLENDLEDTLEICNENFDKMLEMLQDLSNDNPQAEDALVLLAKYRSEPPADKLDRLQLFLAMESCWLRLRK